jgi:hypothetical protein
MVHPVLLMVSLVPLVRPTIINEDFSGGEYAGQQQHAPQGQGYPQQQGQGYQQQGQGYPQQQPYGHGPPSAGPPGRE